MPWASIAHSVRVFSAILFASDALLFCLNWILLGDWDPPALVRPKSLDGGPDRNSSIFERGSSFSVPLLGLENAFDWAPKKEKRERSHLVRELLTSEAAPYLYTVEPFPLSPPIVLSCVF